MILTFIVCDRLIILYYRSWLQVIPWYIHHTAVNLCIACCDCWIHFLILIPFYMGKLKNEKNICVRILVTPLRNIYSQIVRWPTMCPLVIAEHRLFISVYNGKYETIRLTTPLRLCGRRNEGSVHCPKPLVVPGAELLGYWSIRLGKLPVTTWWISDF